MAYKPDLSKLPLHFRKVGKYYYNSKTGKYIHQSNIGSHIPKPADTSKDWTKRYDNY